MLLISACTSVPSSNCGTVASYKVPSEQDDLYPVMLTHIDGVAIVAQANYHLTLGHHKITMVELVSAPGWDFPLKYRGKKTIDIDVQQGMRYHFAAKFNRFVSNPVRSDDFWLPVIWKQEPLSCREGSI